MKNRNHRGLYYIPLLFIALSLSAPATLSAAHFDSSDLTPLNRLNLALNFDANFTPGYFAGLSAGIGTSEWSSIHVQLGYGTDNMSTNAFYARAMFKILLSRFFGGVDKVSISLGPVYHKYVGIYSCLALTTTWKFLEFYTGLDDTVYFRPNETGLMLNFIIGGKMTEYLDFLSISRIKPELIFEIGVPLTSYSSFTFALGLQYKFDFKLGKEKSAAPQPDKDSGF